jgi:hypothetical protein
LTFDNATVNLLALLGTSLGLFNFGIGQTDLVPAFQKGLKTLDQTALSSKQDVYPSNQSWCVLVLTTKGLHEIQKLAVNLGSVPKDTLDIVHIS